MLFKKDSVGKRCCVTDVGSQAYGTTLIDSLNGELASAAEETAQIIGGIEKMWIFGWPKSHRRVKSLVPSVPIP
jgi:hypothetical protein